MISSLSIAANLIGPDDHRDQCVYFCNDGCILVYCSVFSCGHVYSIDVGVCYAENAC